jgi:dTDP-4-dehydrorhamnose reductase
MPSGEPFLIIGASGFIGSHLLAHLTAQGIPAVGTRSRSGKRLGVPNLIPFDLDHDRIVDTVGRDFFAGPNPVQAVVCAAVDNMDWCFRERETSRRIYVDRTCRLMDDLVSVGARPTFISTCFVFDGAEGNYDEDHPVSPVNEYARQKLEVEQHLAAHAPQAWTLRLDKIVGDSPAEETFFTQWYRLLEAGQPIVCIADSILSPTFVEDVAEAIRLGASHRLAGVHHVANPEQFLRADLARLFCRAFGAPDHPILEKPLAQFGFTDARALKSSLNGSRFAHLTGLRHTSMKEVIQRFHARITAR